MVYHAIVERGYATPVFQSFNLAMQTLTLVTYAASGLIDSRAFRMFSIVAPAMLIPTIIGNRLYAHLDQSMFRRLILTILSVSGIAILAALASGSARPASRPSQFIENKIGGQPAIEPGTRPL